MKRAAVLVTGLLLFPSLALAWGEKGHYLVNEAATLSTTTDMPHFFYRGFPDLVWLAFDPDRWKGTGESLDAVNPPDHFLDYEYVAGLELPPSRYAYIAQLHERGVLRKFGIQNDDPGFLPWKIAEVAETLEVLFREWRRTPAAERGPVEHDIIHFAGILGHYVGDSANPQHATTNYNGWLDANPNGYAIDCGTHSRFESNFISHAISVSDVTPKVTATPVRIDDYFAAAVAAVRASNSLVEQLYRIDRDGGFNPIGPPSKEGVDFASSRLAGGATLLRDLWWSAWMNSGERRTERR